MNPETLKELAAVGRAWSPMLSPLLVLAGTLVHNARIKATVAKAVRRAMESVTGRVEVLEIRADRFGIPHLVHRPIVGRKADAL